MVFASHVFVFWFLPVVLALYYAVPKGAKNLVLTLVSYVFYAWAAPQFVVILIWSTLVDYVCGNFISGHWRLRKSRAVNPRIFVAVSLLSNLGLLGFFKYYMFAHANVNALLARFGQPTADVLFVVLPIGISFYTFESISYNLDIYYGRAKPAIYWVQDLAGGRSTSLWGRIGQELRALNAFACYITQFPHLVAGPIIRYQDLESQIHVREHSTDKFVRGIFFFALGMGKKVLIANPMGRAADAAFGAAGLHAFDAWYGLFSYAFQIYFDFSGYSDMAIGLGLMFGFVFNKNFDSPYKAQSLTDFWRRWHISLSTWLRDYLYIPLGGNRKGTTRTYINLLAVMVLGGLWHGASWTFAFWGLIHGFWLALERATTGRSFGAWYPAPLRTATTFVVVNIAWVFFRAATFRDAVSYLGNLFGVHPPTGSTLLGAVFYSPFQVTCFAAAVGLAFFGTQTWDLARRLTIGRTLCAAAVLFWASVALTTQSYNPFLYFRF